jgi:FMN phosphatase YigB (HAD superfamily)
VIKTIIFDLGGVIVPFDFSRAYSRIEQLTGLPREEIRSRLMAADLGNRLESGRLSPQDFFEELCGLLGLGIGFDEFREIWFSIFDRETLIPESVFASLGERHRLLLLSNTNAIHFDMLRERYPLLRHFDHYVLSYEVGAMKPDPRIYREAIRHAGCEPGECFFTDDIARFVEGAKAEGVDAVQFTGLEGLRTELQSRGVVV